jgi:UDP-N-acetylglucosamine 2-epimerase
MNNTAVRCDAASPQATRVAVVFGTRPEAIKLAPVITRLADDVRFSVKVVLTGQHREMVDEIIGPLGIRPDADLSIMRKGQSLTDIVVAALGLLDKLYAQDAPDLVLVQGDTSTAFAAALSAFHRKIAVAHVEAGLRSFDRRNPYPEESNRRMISAVADLHFAPTAQAASHLRAEGVRPEDLFITGNSVIDALAMALKRLGGQPTPNEQGSGHVLLTLHRREAWDGTRADGSNVLVGILAGVRAAALAAPEVCFTYPVHRNPLVSRMAHEHLGGLPNVRLIEPLDYFRFVSLMASSRFVVTDSGGIQEEAPALGVPVLVLRETTERPEALASGWNTLVGTNPDQIAQAISVALATPKASPISIPRPTPFGDGMAASRIRDALLWFHTRTVPRPDDFVFDG